MSKIFASGLYKLSITLLVFSCLGVIFGIISLTGNSDESVGSRALSLVASVVQIAVCALGIHGAKTYSFPALLVGAIRKYYLKNTLKFKVRSRLGIPNPRKYSSI